MNVCVFYVCVCVCVCVLCVCVCACVSVCGVCMHTYKNESVCYIKVFYTLLNAIHVHHASWQWHCMSFDMHNLFLSTVPLSLRHLI